MESNRLTDEELKRLEWECSDDDDAPDLMSEGLVRRLIAEVRDVPTDALLQELYSRARG